MVLTLSTMSRTGSLSPLVSVASIGTRASGASTVVVVNGQTVIDAVASNRSSCKTTTGRGFPVYGPRTAAV